MVSINPATTAKEMLRRHRVELIQPENIIAFQYPDTRQGHRGHYRPPLRRHREQSHLRTSTSPSGRSNSSSTEPQWHVALCLGRIGTPSTSRRLSITVPFIPIKIEIRQPSGR